MAGATLYTSASSQYASSATIPRGSMPMSWSAWVRITGNSARSTIMCASNHTASLNQFAMEIDSGGTLTIYKQNNPANPSQGGGDITLNTWQHVGAVFTSATSMTPYRNGVAGTTNTTSSTPSGITRFVIGARMVNSGVDRITDGDIAMAAVWNVALSANHMKALASGAHPLLVRSVGIKFLTEDGSGWTVANDSGSLTSLAPTNSPTVSDSGPPVAPLSYLWPRNSDIFAVDNLVGRDRYFLDLVDR
jgi:hypothetical protein